MSLNKGTFVVGICLPLLVACWRLPGDFSSLPLDKKVDAYESRFRHGGARSIYAEDVIARNGYLAAEAMTPYIRGERNGIPRFVAINIVWDVQSRGCDLRSSSSTAAIKDLLQKGRAQVDEAIAAEGALDAIVANRHSNSASRGLPDKVCGPKR